MINIASTNASNRIVSKHDFAEIIENTVTQQKSLHATVHFNPGEIICSFSADQVFAEPNYLTIQTGIQQHITLMPHFLQYTNHSCSPNVFFDTHSMELIALKDIEPNEEFTFFYPSTELEMAQPFICFCGSKDCLQNIKGAQHIPFDILKNYRLTRFIQEQLQKPS